VLLVVTTGGVLLVVVTGGVLLVVTSGAVLLVVTTGGVLLVVTSGGVLLVVTTGGVLLVVTTGGVLLVVITGGVLLVVTSGGVLLVVTTGGVLLVVTSGAVPLVVGGRRVVTAAGVLLVVLKREPPVLPRVTKDVLPTGGGPPNKGRSGIITVPFSPVMGKEVKLPSMNGPGLPKTMGKTVTFPVDSCTVTFPVKSTAVPLGAVTLGANRMSFSIAIGVKFPSLVDVATGRSVKFPAGGSSAGNAPNKAIGVKLKGSAPPVLVVPFTSASNTVTIIVAFIGSRGVSFTVSLIGTSDVYRIGIAIMSTVSLSGISVAFATTSTVSFVATICMLRVFAAPHASRASRMDNAEKSFIVIDDVVLSLEAIRKMKTWF
jgi:hypothetical protein